MLKEKEFKLNLQLFAEPVVEVEVVTPPVVEPVVNDELTKALAEIEALKKDKEERVKLETQLAEKDKALKEKEVEEVRLKEELESERKYKEELTKIANSNDDVAKQREALERQLEKEKAEREKLEEKKKAQESERRAKDLEKQLELKALEIKKIEESNNFEKLKMTLMAEKADNKILVDAIKDANSPEILEFVLKTLDKVEIKDKSVMAERAGQNAFSGVGTPSGQSAPKSLQELLNEKIQQKIGKKR